MLWCYRCSGSWTAKRLLLSPCNAFIQTHPAQGSHKTSHSKPRKRIRPRIRHCTDPNLAQGRAQVLVAQCLLIVRLAPLNVERYSWCMPGDLLIFILGINGISMDHNSLLSEDMDMTILHPVESYKYCICANPQ